MVPAPASSSNVESVTEGTASGVAGFRGAGSAVEPRALESVWVGSPVEAPDDAPASLLSSISMPNVGRSLEQPAAILSAKHSRAAKLNGKVI